MIFEATTVCSSWMRVLFSQTNGDAYLFQICVITWWKMLLCAITCYLFSLLITVDFRFVFRQYLFTRGLVPARYAAASPRLRLPDTFFAKKSAARQPVHVLVALRAAEKVGTRRARTPNLRNTAGANMKFHKHSIQHRDNFSLVFIVYG